MIRKAKKQKKLPSHIKAVRLTMILMSCSPLFLYPLQHARALGLKENSMVNDNTIKLGDIFYGLERDEDRVLGAAPRPGQDMTLNAKTLLRIALALDLPWRPSGAQDQVVLRRAATIIERQAIEDSIMASLIDNGVVGDFGVTIPPEYNQIILPADAPAQLEISHLEMDSTKKRFTARISAPSLSNPIQKFEISGTIQPMISIPVLKENIANGRVIQADDIEFTQIKENDFSKDTIADAQSLIGMTARRLLVAGRPVRSSETSAPQLIARGELVTVSLNDGILNLTTQAKALENGSKGDVIRVVNTSSNQSIQAIVTDFKQVKVMN